MPKILRLFIVSSRSVVQPAVCAVDDVGIRRCCGDSGLYAAVGSDELLTECKMLGEIITEVGENAVIEAAVLIFNLRSLRENPVFL